MPKITTFLMFNDQADAAVKLYTSAFTNSKLVSVNRYGDAGPGPKGTIMSATFELEGQPFIAMNGGPSFTMAQGISIFVSCETQAEIDDLWERLTAGGGAPGRCGWLTDPFGVSWQIIPSILGQLLGDKDAGRAQRAMQAMLKMNKLDIEGLTQAADGS
jgi:predicted 3-demethylubiquinone-9 3-methyltransferase (glyoxalase superfamily)